MNASEGVREYVAYHELKRELDKINERLKKDPNYGWAQLESDLAEVSRTAREKYGVTRPEFITEVFNVIKEKMVLSKKLPILQIEYDNNYMYTLLFSFLMDLTFLAGISLDRLLKYLEKRKKTSLVNVVKQLDKTLTVALVFSYFVIQAPFDYEWPTHLTIVIGQFVIFVLILTVLESGRLRFQLDWKGVALRLGFGTMFLIIFLITTPLWVLVFFTLPSMFSSYSIVIGDVTPLSILVATIAVLVITISELIYSRLFG